MTAYLIRRTLQSLLILWLSTILSFSVMQLAPGGPLQFIDFNFNSGQGKSKAEDIERIKRLHGVDRSLPVQYVVWLAGETWLPATPTWRSGKCLHDPSECGRGIIRLDFGRSFLVKGVPVLDVVLERLPATALLAFASLFVSLLVGIPFGMISAFYRGRWPDNLIRVSTVLVNTVPDWWLGLLLLIILGGYFDLVPLNGMGEGSLLNRLHHLLLPAIVSATAGWIGISRILRFGMLDVLSQDYVRTARAKGLPGNLLITRHVLRNALLPFVTGIRDLFLLVIGGSVLFEIVFSWPGMGRLAVSAVSARDFPLLMALFLIGAVLGILGTLVTDIVYGIVDPRIRYDKR